MKKLRLIALALVAGFGLSAALAQVIPVPTVSIINPTDLIQVVPRGVPGAQSQYASPAQITSQSGYLKASPPATPAYAVTLTNSQSWLDLTSSSAITTATVTLPVTPSDGARACIWAQNGITTLTITPQSPATINNAVTSISSATSACYLYSLSTAVWDRD